MDKIIEIQVGEYRGVTFFDLNDIPCNRDDFVIMDAGKGFEFGRMVSDIQTVCKTKPEAISGKVLRKATEGDMKQIENNRMKAKDAMEACLRKISEHKMDMQVIKAEYTFDCSKVIFFFTSEGRVDFRNLVKELAKIFRVRIELKQIGVRDRAKVIGGYGVCGRELCCSSYMKGFHTLSIKMAKDQGLPLNPSRISGVCGRIKCCMAYEFSVYKEFSKGLPSVGDKYDTQEGKGKVIEVNILKKILYVDVGEGKIVKVALAKSDEN